MISVKSVSKNFGEVKVLKNVSCDIKKGERVVFMGQDITAEKDGYVTLYGANHGHIDYLDELAVSLGLR